MSLYFSVSPLSSSNSLSFNPEWVERLFSRAGVVWIGFSGGVDSHVLLHALTRVLSPEQKSRLAAIHVHHGLSMNADDWLTHCDSVCQDLGVRFVARRVLLASQASIEDAARKARYRAFEEVLAPQDVLLMAHHSGDQAETVLFRLLRGTGGKGLAGIPQERDLGSALLIRPLLDTSKDTITAYAKKHGLHWIEDESNGNEKFTRNFLRHRIIPTLETRFPQMEHSIASTAQRLATDYSMLADFAAKQLLDWCSPAGGLILSNFRTLSSDKRLFWLRHFLQERGVSLSHAQLESLDFMVFSDLDKQPEFKFSSGRIMRHQGAIYVLPKDKEVTLGLLALGQIFERDFDQVLVESDGHFSLRERPQGVSILMQNGHTRKLKKWFNDQKVPSWWREHLPYLYLEDELVAIGSLWRHPNYQSIKFSWFLNETLPFPLCD
ncbi:tRNA lysidine(34) synthetase TilS [Marinomonas sp. TI.3.20]|uniref:tRNA lysidine(34) synthetase TilS n=1 Tax=Marinomonas sp. TI.3.20 TaxID=3121296 RepID=UPI00311D9D7D